MNDRDEGTQSSSFLLELKRRNVFRVAVFYVVLSWLTLQVADIVIPALGLPEWGIRLVLVLLVLGFPIVLFFAWVFELTPEGLKREHEVDRSKSMTHATGRRLNFLIIGVLAAAVVVLLIDKFLLRGSPGGADADKTIAVLPFLNVGGDDQSAVFSDGLAETLTHMLAQIGELHVAARTSAFQFRDGAGDVAEIGRQLRVRNLLEGSVRRDGDTIRVTAQLVDAENGFHLWSGSYDRRLADVFAIQDDIADRVVEALQVTLLGKESALDIGGTDDIEAYTEFLRGRQQQALFTFESLPRAAGHYRQALRIDPDYAQAQLALVETYVDMTNTGLIRPDEAIEKAEPLLANAAALIGQTAEVLTNSGRVEQLRGDRAAAQRAFLAALEIDPNNVAALSDYAEFLIDTLEHPAGALPYARRALDFDPRSERLLQVNGKALADLGREQEALEQFARVRAINPDNPAGYYYAAFIHQTQGDYVGAIDWLLKAIEKDPSDHELPIQIGRYLLDLFDPDAAEIWIQRSLEINKDSVGGRAALLDLHGYRNDRVQGLAVARSTLADGAPERFGARWLSLWWLLNEAMLSGDYAEFLGWLEKLYPRLFETPPAIDANSEGEAPLLMRAYLKSGETEKARLLRDLLRQRYAERVSQEPDAMLIERLMLHAVFGQTDEALDLFERHLEVGDLDAIWAMEIEPDIDALRATDRYRQLMAQVKADLAKQRQTIIERHGF